MTRVRSPHDFHEVKIHNPESMCKKLVHKLLKYVNGVVYVTTLMKAEKETKNIEWQIDKNIAILFLYLVIIEE